MTSIVWKVACLASVVAACSQQGGNEAAPPRGHGEGGSAPAATVGAGGAEAGGAPASGGSDVVAGADVRMLTINLQTFLTGGEPEARTAIVADVVNSLQPDFVALQEIAQSYDVDNRAEALAAATGYAWGWQVAHDFGLYQEGTGYLSRWPVTWSDAIELPHGDVGGTKRVTVGVGVDTPHGVLSFFSSHATLDPDESVKADQALATWQLMNDNQGGGAAFLGADMNAQPDTLAMRFLRGEASHGGEVGDLVDAWLAASPADPGLTNPATAPDKRIDYLYARGATPVACQLILGEPVEGLYASDHLGVMCDFQLRR